ncbi:MAG TPA: hypothetical protein VGI14_14645 [Casimicrobiaceae bacterium]|jgi:hypothetical protein
MSRQHTFVRRTAFLAAFAALAASTAAFADDSSMSVWTGDSYAYFNGLDYSLGKFNVARGPSKATLLAHRQVMAGDSVIDVEHAAAVGPAAAPGAPVRKTLRNPFRDDTGQ